MVIHPAVYRDIKNDDEDDDLARSKHVAILIL